MAGRNDILLFTEPKTEKGQKHRNNDLDAFAANLNRLLAADVYAYSNRIRSDGAHHKVLVRLGCLKGILDYGAFFAGYIATGMVTRFENPLELFGGMVVGRITMGGMDTLLNKSVAKRIITAQDKRMLNFTGSVLKDPPVVAVFQR
jgi:hypothetical protein